MLYLNSYSIFTLDFVSMDSIELESYLLIQYICMMYGMVYSLSVGVLRLFLCMVTKLSMIGQRHFHCSKRESVL